MGAYKNPKTGTWFVQFRYTDWKSERQQKFKRGFATKREAKEWEQKFLMMDKADVTMTFEAFAELYERDIRPRLKENTWLMKASILKNKIMPYFGKKRLCDITAKDILAWQNEFRKLKGGDGNGYSITYLKTVHNQLSAMLSHAVRYYGLRSNPASIVGNMGHEEKKEMLFWTLEEYKKFSEEIMDKPIYYYAFQMLYWCGIRIGELLALTPGDFDFKAQTVRINKSYQRLQGRDVITSPKTKKSVRTIKMPPFLCDEIQDYLGMFYGAGKDDRIFLISKTSLGNEITRGAKKSGVKRIRVHDLRHSHVSLLINSGFTALAIAERLGHESIEVTYRYAHLFPSVQTEMANKLETLGNGGMNHEPKET